jgi:filamentous hemagglutinin family protein
MNPSRYRKHQTRIIALCVFLACSGNAYADPAIPAPDALPSGGQLVSGQATIIQNGSVMQIDQTTAKAAIDWSNFSIGSQAQVKFIQPDVNSVALNRVVLANPSVIEGKLSANGQVFLINPSGVFFGNGAQVDVGGLVASTMNISIKDFEEGTSRFTRDGSKAEVVNQGEITAKEGGYIALIGATVRNEGTITANGGGTVALASGDAVSLEFTGGKLLNVAVDASTVESLIENRKLIRVDGGRVLMTTAAASALQGAVINNTGTVEANSLSTDGGVIRLVGSTVKNNGTLAASGGSIGIQADDSIEIGGSISASMGTVTMQSAGSITSTDTSTVSAGSIVATGGYISLAGQMETAGGLLSLSGTSAVLLSPTSGLSADGANGGTVEITSASGFVLASGLISAHGFAGSGGTVKLAGAGSTTLLGATIEASGLTRGGKVRVGKSGETLASASVFIDASSSIAANARLFGQGGSIDLWSTNATSIYGKLSASGGVFGGGGGLIDISSAGVVNQAQGSLANFSVAGTPTGTISEDPINVVIGDAMTSFDVFKSLLNMSGSGVSTGQPVTGLPSNSYFGCSVALNSTYALIGAYNANTKGDAYLYNLSTGSWTDLATTSGQPVTGLGTGSYFGSSVALNSTYALIGAPGVSTMQGDAYLYNLSTGTWTDIATGGLSIPSGARFGSSVALNSTYALIGAPGVSSMQGDAYLYNLSTGTLTDLATTGLSIPSSARFGYSVALNSAYALIGAPGVSSIQGNAYLYNFSTGTWTDIATCGLSIPSNAKFGSSVALNSTYALIGAPGVSSMHGDAYLYNLSTGTWTDLVSTSGLSLTNGATFGNSVALNSNYALIGAVIDKYSQGDAYLFNLSTGACTDLATTPGAPSPSSLDEVVQLGAGVALNEKYALIGARNAIINSKFTGDAYLYDLSTGTWTDLASATARPLATIASNSNFGYSVALNSTYALIGAPGVSTDRGDAYLYNLSTGDWLDLATTSGQQITALAPFSGFGAAVALSDTYALVGAPGSSPYGNAYLYDLSSGSWTNLVTTSGQPIHDLEGDPQFGFAVALNSTYALIGAPGVPDGGNAYLYDLSSGAWTDLSATAGQPVTALYFDSYFGQSVALNSSYALIGAPGAYSNRGTAYLFDLSKVGTAANGWTDLSTTGGQPVTGLSGDSWFGQSVALNSAYALIGATGVSSYRGDAYLYNLSTGAWTDLSLTSGQLITALPINSYFGSAVALNDTYALIGAPNKDNVSIADQGDAYLYSLSTGAWVDMTTLFGQPVTALSNNSYFGQSVALNSTYALIGAPYVSSDRGNAWLVYLPELVDDNGLVTLVTPETIAAAIQNGNYTLTADNDLTVKGSLGLTPTAAGSGHTLTFRAGRSIAVNAPVDVSSYPTIFLANAPTSDLGSADNRQAGAGGITVASGASIIDAGSTLTLHVGPQVESGRDAIYGESGPISVESFLSAGSIIENAPDNSVYNNAVTVASTGTTTVDGVTAGIFINAGDIVDVSGATLLAVGSRWLIFDSLNSQPWNSVTLGSNTASFTRFGYGYGTGTSVGTVIPSSGNGMVYAVSPHLTVSGIGIANKPYDGNTVAAITGQGSLSGIPTSTKTGTLTSDVTGVTFTSFGVGAGFNDKNAGNDKPVTMTSNNAFGYMLDMPSGLKANITAKALELTGSRIYNGSTEFSAAQFALGGVIAGDTVNLSGSADVSIRNVGSYTSFASSTLGLDNGNYTLTGGTINAEITKAGLTIMAVSNTKTFDETTMAAATPTVSGLQSGDTVSGLMESYDTASVGTAKTLSVTGYTIDDGNGGHNYTVGIHDATGSIEPALISLDSTPESGALDPKYGDRYNYNPSGIPAMNRSELTFVPAEKKISMNIVSGGINIGE